MFKNTIVFLFSLFWVVQLTASKRILYVDNFNSILGNSRSEEKLLGFAKKYGFNCLVLYELNKVHKQYPLTNKTSNSILAKFISLAKADYNIKEIAAVGEATSFFNDIIDVYNNSRTSQYEKFDVYNLEFEYWSANATGNDGYYCENYLQYNNFTCDRAGAFKYFMNDLKDLKQLASKSKHKIKVEAFVGYFLENELKEIVKYADRIIVESYDKNPKLCYSITKSRLAYLASLPKNIETSILFSATMTHMGYWLKYNSLDKSEKDFLNEMKTKNSTYVSKLTNLRFGYHTYSFLEKSLSYYAYSKN